jgi:hypothetical protein
MVAVGMGWGMGAFVENGGVGVVKSINPCSVWEWRKQSVGGGRGGRGTSKPVFPIFTQSMVAAWLKVTCRTSYSKRRILLYLLSHVLLNLMVHNTIVR